MTVPTGGLWIVPCAGEVGDQASVSSWIVPPEGTLLSLQFGAA